MLIFTVDGLPTPWRAATVTRRGAFNPKHKEKEYARWQIKSQYNQLDPLAGPIRLDLSFHMPVPQGTSKIRRTQMLNGTIHHLNAPFLTGLVLFVEECLIGTIIENRQQIFDLSTKKIFSLVPKTVIQIYQSSDEKSY